ncbi:hypothetical protein MJC1_03951 [Methylocystis sp. MJC1]|nr:hypothetical protein MJC1_03951 [Methylocystis sp. MJC1]
MTVNAIETNDRGNTERADLHLIVGEQDAR